MARFILDEQLPPADVNSFVTCLFE